MVYSAGNSISNAIFIKATLTLCAIVFGLLFLLPVISAFKSLKEGKIKTLPTPGDDGLIDRSISPSTYWIAFYLIVIGFSSISVYLIYQALTFFIDAKL
jgi:hypothetical protein